MARAVGLSLLALGVLLASCGDGSEADSGTEALAKQNAGGEVRVFTGPNHTVYQAVAALPSASAPRADGKPTLVWFSGTNCHFCEQMEPFAHRVAGDFGGRMVFMEKAVDKDESYRSYGVRGTPTFILLDARGKELGRFGFQSTREAFAAAIDDALKRAGA